MTRENGLRDASNVLIGNWKRALVGFWVKHDITRATKAIEKEIKEEEGQEYDFINLNGTDPRCGACGHDLCTEVRYGNNICSCGKEFNRDA
jgi:hypothetical protein